MELTILPAPPHAQPERSEMDNSDRCETCKHYHPLETTDEAGWCYVEELTALVLKDNHCEDYEPPESVMP